MAATRRNPPLWTALLACAAALLWSEPSSAAPHAERVSEPAREVREYWTDARLRAAEPVDAPELGGAASDSAGGAAPAAAGTPAAVPPEPGAPRLQRGKGSSQDIFPGDTRDEITDPGAPEFSAHGKVFFTVPAGDNAGDYVCSGTAVNSRNRSVVWTAGHCVLPEESGGFATNWIFIPGYSEDAQPYGQWPAKRLATTGPWQESRNIKYDLGAAVVRRSPQGERLGSLVATRGIAFDQPRDHLYAAYGYPAVATPLAPEFSGEREFRCVSRPVGTDNPGTAGPPATAIECDMTGGSSGGGWIVDGTLLTVTSYGYQLELETLYGPYMSTGAKSLYRNVRGKPRKKSGPKKGGGKSGKGGRR